MLILRLSAYYKCMEKQNVHSLTIENNKRVTASAINSVEAFSQKSITLNMENSKIIITGDDLKIVSFSESSKIFSAVGKILGIKYVASHAQAIKKLFR